MARVPDSALIKFAGWTQGVDNLSREDSVRAQRLRAGVNIDIDPEGKVTRRPGRELADAAPGLHSLYSIPRFPLMLAATPTELRSYDRNLTVASLATLNTDAPVSYASVSSWVYYTNGRERGQVFADGVRRDWAPEFPGGQPFVTEYSSAGGLAAGKYQVAITFMDVYGRESGATLAVELEIAAGSGLLLTAFPLAADPDTQTIRIYATPPNGDVLYFVQDLPIGTTQFLLGAHTPGAALDKQFLSPMPAGQIVRSYGGRLHVAVGNMHLWSEAMMYGMYKRHGSYARYEQDITMMEPAGEADASGMFVGTASRVYFLTGPDPKNWQRVIASPAGAVLGSSLLVDSAEFEIKGVQGLLPLWMSTTGQLTLGLPSGQVLELHADRYSGPQDAEHASLAVRHLNGAAHVIAALRGGQVATGMRARDTVEAEVWKNGVRIS